MILTVEQLKTIALAGGSLTLDASAFTFNQLREITVAAATGNASISLRNLSGFTASQLAEISALAPRLISFDLAG